MRIEIQLRIVDDDNSVISADEVLYFNKSDDRVEAIGLSFGDAKAVLGAIQERVVTAQAASFLARHRCCNGCGRALLSTGRIQFRTAFGTIPLNSPRFLPLLLSAFGQQDLQPAGRAVHRTHCPGAPVSGNEMGLAGFLRPDCPAAERGSTGRQHRQRRHHSPPPAQGRCPP
jgi:hypothetical protein